MKKVSSAPNLQDYSSKRSSNDQPTGQRMPKTSSNQSLVGSRRKDSLIGSKLRNVSTDSLASLIAAVGPPSVAELQEFSESAKGLAGLDCYEKFGTPELHPSLTGDTDEEVPTGRARVAQEAQRDEEEQAMAACLATPYAADERNLGEQVEEAARQARSAAEEELGGRLEQTAIAQNATVHKTDERDEGRSTPQRRKRRMLRTFGLGSEIDPEKPNRHFEDNETAEQYLLHHASLEANSNRLHLPDEWACNEDVCHPVYRIDSDIFATL